MNANCAQTIASNCFLRHFLHIQKMTGTAKYFDMHSLILQCYSSTAICNCRTRHLNSENFCLQCSSFMHLLVPRFISCPGFFCFLTWYLTNVYRCMINHVSDVEFAFIVSRHVEYIFTSFGCLGKNACFLSSQVHNGYINNKNINKGNVVFTCVAVCKPKQCL